MERVKFFSINDVMYGYNLRNSERVIKEYGSVKKVQDINDIIELYNVKKYFDNKIYLSDWTPEDISYFERTIKSCIGNIAQFFKSITKDSFATEYNKVDKYYKEDFWELIEKFKVYENISEDKFQEFLNTSIVHLYQLLKHKNTTEHFGEIIRNYMLNDNSSAELLLDEYEIKHMDEKEPLYFPKKLTNPDKETIICNYIDRKDPNLNYLRLIANIQSSKDKLEISPKTLLKAKRKAEELEKDFFTENSGFSMEIIVGFKAQDEVIDFKADEQAITAIYSKKWIKDNNDYPTLLNNFIYLFDFVDFQIRFTLTSKYNLMSVIERFLFTSSKNAYTKGILFEQKNILSLFQMLGYYNELFSIGIRLEEIIEWFFREYLNKEFKAHGFKVTMPSNNSTLLEKCTNIMPAMESVLKQFSLFVREGEIDFELLEIRS